MEDSDIRAGAVGGATYSIAARRFHWWTVLLVLTQIPLGVYMHYRGNMMEIWDGLTNALYSTHKLLGVVIFLLVLARLFYRLSHGAPPDEPTLAWWQKAGAHFNHWALYLALLVVPVLGYIGVSLYPALDIFGLFSLPGIVAPDQGAAARVFYWHFIGAVAIVLLIGMHVGAALFHYVIRKDGVLRRMWVLAGRLG
jgi:cytochrome b561